jgi:hypothetical protein
MSMPSRWASVVTLALAVIGGRSAPLSAQSAAGTPPVSPSHVADPSGVRTRVTSLGVGRRVVVRFADSSKVTGRIGAIEADTFTVRPDGGSPTRTIPYADVRKVSSKMSGKAKTLMFIGIGVGAYALGYWIAVQFCCH